MRFILLLISPFIFIVLLFLFLPRPSFQTTPTFQAEEPTQKPVDTAMETKIRDVQKAKDVLDKVDADTKDANKRLADFYARFHISPTPYEIADLPPRQVNNTEQITNNSQQDVLSASVDATTGSHIGEIEENPIRTTYVIALLGDSMIDTLNPYLSDFKTQLSAKYPHYSFGILNFGEGSTDLASGLARLTSPSNYNGKYFPSVLSYKPDVLVIESFAYNPWSNAETDLNRQWITFAKMVDTVKEKSPDTKILFAATIGPNPYKFGDNSLNWSETQKKEKTDTIKKYLLNLIRFTQSQNMPLADAYSESVDASGNGQTQFITSSDYIHPSKKGATLFFSKIVEGIEKNKLLP